MKVKTNLKSGGMLEDAANEVNKAVNQVTGFVTEASTAAESITNSVYDAGKCITNAL